MKSPEEKRFEVFVCLITGCAVLAVLIWMERNPRYVYYRSPSGMTWVSHDTWKQ